MSLKFVRSDSSGSGQSHCATLQQLLADCPNYSCLQHPASSLNLAEVYQLTAQCFDQINRKLSAPPQVSRLRQVGGGGVGIVGPGPQPSGDLYEGPLSNVKDLYINVRKYMQLYNIKRLTPTTMIPFGIIEATLNLPHDKQLLLHMYQPHLRQYLLDNNLLSTLTPETLLPIGLFLDDIDLDNIHHLKLE